MFQKSKLQDKVQMVKRKTDINESQKICLISKIFEEIHVLDSKISELSSERNVRFIRNNFLSLTSNDIFSVQNMWKNKQRIDSKCIDIPTAKYNSKGQLITTRAGILTLYEGYEELQKFKDYLFKLRLE